MIKVNGEDFRVYSNHKTRIDGRFEDWGCGFLVVIENCPMVSVLNGIWTPNINYDEYHRYVAKVLIEKENSLTGRELKFLSSFYPA